MKEYLGILIDTARDEFIPEKGMALLSKKGFYKKDNETSPQETMARAATCYCFGDYEFAQRMYDYQSKAWYVDSSPVKSNAIEIEWPTFGTDEFQEAGDWLEENVVPDGLPISCFAAGTPVYTSNGVVSIENIEKGMKVLTHKGRFRQVLATKKSYSSDIYELQCSSNTTKLTVTGNHLVYTNVGWKRVDELEKGVHLIAQSNFIEKGLVEDLHINTTDLSVEKYNTGNYDTVSIPSKVLVDVDLAWALGFWFAEGSTSDNGQVRVTHGDIEPCKKWQEIISSKFGLNGRSYKAGKTRNWYNGEVNSVQLQRNFDKIFGKGCKTKLLPAEWMEATWGSDIFDAFLEGFYLGDGFKTTNTKMFELTNVQLVSQIALMLLQQGYRVSAQYRKYNHHNKSKNNGVYNGIVSYSKKNTKRIGVRDGVEMHDGLRYTAIEIVRKMDEEDIEVYDIQVEEDESFSASGIIAHNCFLSYIPDTKEGLTYTRNETAWLSMMGGGVGIYTGMRSPDEKSTGAMAHLKGYDADTLSYKQKESRRGSIAAYMDIDHPEIKQFISMRDPAGGGDINKKCFNMNNAVNITDSFMEKVITGGEYELIDPKHGPTGDFLNARKVFEELMEMRHQTGEPYLNFIDTVNRSRRPWITKKSYYVSQSNLC